LWSGEIVSVQIEALSGAVMIGGIQAGEMPVYVAGQRGLSSVGFFLPAGVSGQYPAPIKEFAIDNFNRIRIVALTSGDIVSFMGVAQRAD